MRELIATVVINNYVREVELSKSRRTAYYKPTDNIEKMPLKLMDRELYKLTGKKKLSDRFVFMKLGKDKARVLYDKTTCEKVIANPVSAGKPRVKIINGQDLHRLTLLPYHASKIKKAIKEQFIKEVEKLDYITQVPIIVECEIRDTYDDLVNEKSYTWDVDNRYLFYGKVFVDVLSGTPDIIDGKVVTTSKAIIKNDHRGYVTGGGFLFTPIKDIDVRQLIFRIYHDKREIVSNFANLLDKDYQETFDIIIEQEEFNQPFYLMLL